ncbi:MAG: M1 family metallopeptidase [Arachidicoccus sp.]|nr:M1 family metallopeptidase [Arachidicoccus sp.]
MRKILFSLLSVIVINSAFTQNYNPHKAFAPEFYTSNGNTFRSENGAPGSEYWQNKADYKINAAFDTSASILKGNEEITYTNYSPDNLDYIWLELDQNAEKQNSIGNILNGNVGMKDSGNNGFIFQQVQVFQNGKWEIADYNVQGAYMQLSLKNTLPRKSGILKIKIDYSFKLLTESANGRGGILPTKNGKIYEFAYWFPRLCVYDDVNGWNTLPFIGGGEFYLDYGDYDYSVTVPYDLLLTGSGELINREEILNKSILRKINEAKNSDKTVIIRSAQDVQKGVSPTQKSSGNVTWHFTMKNSRDVAFAASKAFVYDGAKTNLKSGKKCFSQSFYPVESIEDGSGWARATEYLKASVEDFSTRWFEFPYPEAVNVGGPVGGMEFPALTFDYWRVNNAKNLWSLLSHEIGHSWFPMIVGSDERRFPFMDEGFNTFVDIYAQADYNKGEFAPKRDGEYAPKGGNPADEIIPVIDSNINGNNLLTYPDRMDYKWVHPLAYFKTSFGLVLLREYILGKDRFDYAFRKYVKDWAFKHPQPTDFFRSMDNASGEDLSWFWRGWFYNNWQLDQAVMKVEYLNNDDTKGALITIENKQQLPMPVTIEIKEENGKTQTVNLPVEVWMRGGTWTFKAPTTSKVTSVTIDPQHQLPDIDRSNNSWHN